MAPSGLKRWIGHAMKRFCRIAKMRAETQESRNRGDWFSKRDAIARREESIRWYSPLRDANSRSIKGPTRRPL